MAESLPRPSPSQPATQHQTFMPMPKLDAPIIDEGGRWNFAWYRFIIRLWELMQSCGCQNSSTPNTAFLQSANGNPPITVWTLNGQVGTIVLTPGTPPPEEPQTAAVSPLVYVAPENGKLIVSSAQLEIARSGAAWYLVSPNGGALPMLQGDQARVTWFTGTPAVTWYPD